jgi:serine/threonine protein kinase/tetratricopeptide (TPR) repeat protein
MSQSNQPPASDAARDGADGGEATDRTVRLGKPKPARPSQPASHTAPMIAPPHGAPCGSGLAGPHSRGGDQGLVPFPGAGDALFGYRVREELGRGAFAHVFLAEQADLAGRLVVLKVSAIEGGEPQTLAQMQHTHIVPIYCLHEDRSLGLRAVCMPYFGGATLARTLGHLWGDPEPPTRGSQLAAALVAVRSTPPLGPGLFPDGAGGGTDIGAPLRRFEGWDYTRCAAWIVTRLAEALQHAHDRGVLHRDVKPSNILLSADGQPLLLDFNMSGQLGKEASGSYMGGTVAYAAPEHLRALMSATPELVAMVDRRSDVYALGIVLFEMLGGATPFGREGSSSVGPEQLARMASERAGPPPSVRGRRPDVPWSLDSIVRRCLEPDPGRRYQQAGHLAEDLRRFLDDQPLKFATEPSRAERLWKCLRRHPRLTSSGAVAAVCALLLIGAAGAFAGVRGHLARAREQLLEAQARDRRKAYEAGTLRALCLVNTVTDLDDNLPEGVLACEKTLALYEVLGRTDWEEQPDWRRLAPEDRRRLAENSRELLHLLAWARVRAAPADAAVLRGALDLLARAEAITGLPPSRAVRAARADYLEALGDSAAATARAEAEVTPPAGAQDHYLLATTYARAGGKERLMKAVAELNEALRLNPSHYWALTQRGICYQDLGESLLAVADFSTCAGLWPEGAWGHFNRGYAFWRAGKTEQARDDFSAALERDPAFVPARMNRGLTRLERKEYGAALDDFDGAAGLGRDDAVLHAGRGMALEGLGRHDEADTAFDAAFARAGALAAPARVRLRWTYGFAVAPRHPDRAARAFDAALRDDPAQPQALYGRAMLAAERGDLPEAAAFADRAVAADPTWVDARRCRAIVGARRGEFARAEADINWCLDREPRAGATLYAAACVAARAAARFPTSGAGDQAVDFLRRAFAEGYGREKAATDPDLAAVRRHARFAPLLADGQAVP